MDAIWGEATGDVLFRSLHSCFGSHHLLSCCSSAHFVVSYAHFVSSHPFWSFVGECVCARQLFSGKKAGCLWSINPLNAIKHTMHRRWPFKTNMHSLQTHSCATGSSSHNSALSMSIVDKEIVSFDLSVIFTDKKKISLFNVENQPTTGVIRPMSNVSVQF